MGIEITVNRVDIDFAKQIRFATASTLTKVAGRSQDAVDAALFQEFHIRSQWWKQSNKYGIRIKRATSADLESAVYTEADWLLESEGYHAGVKAPFSGQHLTIPDATNTRHGIQNKIKRTEKAGYLLANAAQTRAFKVITKGGYTLILQRKGGRGGRGGKTSTVITKYIFKKTVTVPHQSAVVEPTQKTVLNYVGRIFAEELTKAIQSAR